MNNWNHKELWRKWDKYFSVEVSRHEEAVPEQGHCYDSEGPHRWCVYAYVYPGHPLFAQFDASKSMWSQPAMPGHGGVSFYKPHLDHKTQAITSHQIGWDYNHLHDWRFTQMASPDAAHVVFSDAQELFDFLKAIASKEAA